MIIVAGADPVNNQPVAAFLIKRAVDKGVRLVVVNDTDNGLDPFAFTNLPRWPTWAKPWNWLPGRKIRCPLWCVDNETGTGSNGKNWRQGCVHSPGGKESIRGQPLPSA